MNSHQRKKLATAKHYRMPLGCAVRVRESFGITYIGTLGKHDRRGCCIVHFAEHNPLTLAANPHALQPFAWVSYYRIKPLETHRVRPWWRVLRARATGSTS